MGALEGTIHEGKVIFPKPTELPEGTEVEVIPVHRAAPFDEAPLRPTRSPGFWRPWMRSSPSSFQKRSARRSPLTASRERTGRRPDSMSTPSSSGRSGNEEIPVRHRYRR